MDRDSRVAAEQRAIEAVNVKKLIHVVREQQVILDSDLAALYGTTTSAFNQAVRRNILRFPEQFRFQLTKEEYEKILRSEARLTSQNVMSKVSKLSGRGGRRYLPYAFTGEGVAMLASVLRSGTAVQTSIHIVRSFVEMRHFIAKHAMLFEQIKHLELKQLEYQRENDKKIAKIFDMIEERKCHEPMQKLFFEGQIYDAHSRKSRFNTKLRLSYNGRKPLSNRTFRRIYRTYPRSSLPCRTCVPTGLWQCRRSAFRGRR